MQTERTFYTQTARSDKTLSLGNNKIPSTITANTHFQKLQDVQAHHLAQSSWTHTTQCHLCLPFGCSHIALVASTQARWTRECPLDWSGTLGHFHSSPPKQHCRSSLKPPSVHGSPHERSAWIWSLRWLSATWTPAMNWTGLLNNGHDYSSSAWCVKIVKDRGVGGSGQVSRWCTEQASDMHPWTETVEWESSMAKWRLQPRTKHHSILQKVLCLFPERIQQVCLAMITFMRSCLCDGHSHTG